jgi:wobble nucleotide-excising tRNase
MIQCSNEENGRTSSIVKLDSLLQDYESEYHYLFKLLYIRNEIDDGSYESVYHFPNITRRYLEMFFSFRAPVEKGMHRKIEKVVKEGAITQEEGTALRNYLNVYSHGDSQESFTRFDITHLAKSNEAIESVLNLVKNYDERHYEDMVKLVS